GECVGVGGGDDGVVGMWSRDKERGGVTVGGNSVYTTGYVNVDANILKTFHLTEQWKLEFRAEIFNLTNTENFNTPLGTNATQSGASLLNVSTTGAGTFLDPANLDGDYAGRRN